MSRERNYQEEQENIRLVEEFERMRVASEEQDALRQVAEFEKARVEQEDVKQVEEFVRAQAEQEENVFEQVLARSKHVTSRKAPANPSLVKALDMGYGQQVQETPDRKQYLTTAKTNLENKLWDEKFDVIAFRGRKVEEMVAAKGKAADITSKTMPESTEALGEYINIFNQFNGELDVLEVYSNSPENDYDQVYEMKACLGLESYVIQANQL